MKQKQLEPYSWEKEEEVKSFWKKAKIPEKVRAQSSKQRKPYYFMDGPPYATGHIHMGTALNKILKDVALRSKRMQGFNVFDRPGYDCHGLPIENKVEQKLGFKSKGDIERFGVKKFVAECRRYATQFIDVMNNEFADLGTWMGWENPYLTLTNDYIEAIWWTFKKAEEKQLLYKGLYPVHVCPHCETAVAYNEIEYTKLRDEAIFIKFKVRGQQNTYLIIWTTTPWTLPGNTGVMVHPKYSYSEVQLSNGEKWIIASDLVEELMNAIEAGYTVTRRMKGKELEGLRYENPLAKHLKLPKLENAYRVILSERYVNLEEGTGLVHTAPGHGKEDFEAGGKAGLPAISPVQLNGVLTAEAGKYAGKKCREVDAAIVADLEEASALVYRHPYTHDYPLCWRCKSPLLMLSVPQYFFKITGILKKMMQFNKEVNWVPSWMQDRMHNWLESIGDWPISRARYWGTPIPIWQCEKCNEQAVVGSIAELEKLGGKRIKDLHKPAIDAVEIKCSCGSVMKRIPEVLDVWFDSGVSSWAALGFPQKKKLFESFWPADLNLEGTDQFRGWWNSQLILSTIAFDKAPFKNILVHGIVLSVPKKGEMKKAEKMSKSLGNIIAPRDVIEKYNRDFLRYYLISTSRGEDFAFEWDAFKDIARFFNILFNSYNYASMYLNLKLLDSSTINAKKLEVEDKWILSRLNSVVGEVVDAYNNYTYFKAIQAIENFVLEDFSRTYIKLVRDRADAAVSRTMSICLDTLLRLLAPIAPHITEYLYQSLKGTVKGKAPESVHLLGMPVANKKLVDAKLEKEMEGAKELIQGVLALREQQKLRRRWPLRDIVIVSKTGKEFKKVLPVIARSCNVKKAREQRGKPAGNYAEAEVAGVKVFLNIEADEKLKEEWELQELRRKIQEERKKAKLVPQQKVKLLIASSDEGFLKKHKKEIEKGTNTKMKVVKGKGKMEKLLERSFSIELKK